MGFKSFISNATKQQNYMKDIYSNFWSKSRNRYGFIQQDKDLIKEFANCIDNNGVILDVGIGDGHPFANQFNKMGYKIYGIDISPTHVSIVEKEFPNIVVAEGDAQNLEFSDNFFNGVYCFRSSWYFPDLELSIKEMIRVLKETGILMFDIQNMNHPIYRQGINKLLSRSKYPYQLEVLLRFTKNIIKLLLSPIKYYQNDWSIKKHVIISSSPTDPNDLHSFFSSRTDVRYKIYGVESDKPSTLVEINKGETDKYSRLVYKIRKISNN